MLYWIMLLHIYISIDCGILFAKIFTDFDSVLCMNTKKHFHVCVCGFGFGFVVPSCFAEYCVLYLYLEYLYLYLSVCNVQVVC